ncbi:MAG: hypothetical protein ACLTNH_00745 [Enterocloster sp.]
MSRPDSVSVARYASFV